MAVRVAGHYAFQRGYIRNVTTGLKGPKDTDWGVRGQLKFDNHDNFNALLSYQHSDNKEIGSSAQCVPPGLAIPGVPGAPYAPGTSINAVCGDGVENDVRASYSSDARLSDGDDYNRTRADIVHATLNYDLGPATITAITAGVRLKTLNAVDFDFDNKDDSVVIRDEHYKQFTQELRIASNDPKAQFQYILGAFYLHSRFTLLESRIWGTPDFPPGSPIKGQLFNGSYFGDFRQKDDTASVFGQVTFKLTAKISVDVGGRYSHDHKVVHFGRTPDYNNLTLWNTVIQAPFPFQRLTPATDNLVSGSIALQYKFNRDVTIYVSAARSGKAGGYGEFSSVPADPALPLANGLPQGNPNRDSRVKPERANAFEAGVKSNLFDNLLTIDAAAFWTDIFNLQQVTFRGSFILTNDRIRDQGAEANITLRATPNLTFNASATYARVRDLRNKQDSVNAPRFASSGSVEWRLPINDDLGIKLRSGFRNRARWGIHDRGTSARGSKAGKVGG